MLRVADQKTPVKVSICMITYNHEPYIREAIESAISQITDFKYCLVIGEDHSTDGTPGICREYAQRYPEKIQLITSDDNVGMMNNFLRTLKACTGQYIAFLEGDDYWTEPYKLQRQVDFLDANPQCSLCFHNALIKMDRSDGKKEWVMHQNLEKDSFGTADLLGPWFIASASCVFVNYTDLHLPDWYYHCKYGDLPLMLLLSLRGQFKYLNEVMAVYRLHDAGVSNQHKGLDKIILMTYIYENFNIYTNYRFDDKIKECIRYEINKHMPADPSAIGPVRIGKKPLMLAKIKGNLKKMLQYKK